MTTSKVIQENVTVSTKDWLEATKDVVISAYIDSGILTELVGADNEGFTQADFDATLRKVSRKKSLPVGENIRDAVRSLRGK